MCKRTHFDFAFLVPYLSLSPSIPYSMILSHYALSNVPPLHQQPQTDMKDEMKQEAVDAVVRYVSSIDSTYYTCIHTTHVPSAQRCKRHPDTHLFPQPSLRESRLLSFYRFNPISHFFPFAHPHSSYHRIIQPIERDCCNNIFV